MSFRTMLKVSFLMLLAMSLAATSVHARLDLFGQLLTSKNQPHPNSDYILNKSIKLYLSFKQKNARKFHIYCAAVSVTFAYAIGVYRSFQSVLVGSGNRLMKNSNNLETQA
ncbi:PREDICTED: uncharacterized protein LOC101312647 isoform 1 [Fragaria vesca subsp. vesca]